MRAAGYHGAWPPRPPLNAEAMLDGYKAEKELANDHKRDAYSCRKHNARFGGAGVSGRLHRIRSQDMFIDAGEWESRDTDGEEDDFNEDEESSHPALRKLRETRDTGEMREWERARPTKYSLNRPVNTCVCVCTIRLLSRCSLSGFKPGAKVMAKLPSWKKYRHAIVVRPENQKGAFFFVRWKNPDKVDPPFKILGTVEPDGTPMGGNSTNTTGLTAAEARLVKAVHAAKKLKSDEMLREFLVEVGHIPVEVMKAIKSRAELVMMADAVAMEREEGSAKAGSKITIERYVSAQVPKAGESRHRYVREREKERKSTMREWRFFFKFDLMSYPFLSSSFYPPTQRVLLAAAGHAGQGVGGPNGGART